jgi:hypothetical protein
MPYIDKNFRNRFDIQVEKLASSLCDVIPDKDVTEFDAHSLLDCSGNLNYVITRLCSCLLQGKPSYSKVAVITGVLENVKQEFYRRIASPYEDRKIEENGDVKEYRKV